MLIAREDEPDRFTVVQQAESVRDKNGVHQRWEITRTWSEDELAAVGLYRVRETTPPPGRTVVGFGVQRVDGVVQQVLQLGELVDDLINYSANKRWETETQGILTSLGFGVLTDRESQSMINGAFSFVQSNPDRIVHWKTSPTEFTELDKSQVEQLANDVAEHVQKCFAAERLVNERIVNGAITDAEQIDVAFGEELDTVLEQLTR